MDAARGSDVRDENLAEAHGLLAHECRFYELVTTGAYGDPSEHCEHTVKLTPHTAEASTVHKPTRPPGGPGLFHIKGKQLPPYLDVQHLYAHLVKRYGEHRAYGVAIGIVKKWAAGINPGGKGKGHKVHKDVQAAAGKNVAEWERDKAEAHAHRGKGDGKKEDVKATASSGPTKTKAEAHYRPATSHQACGGCSMFRDGACTLVQGSIDPAHVCDYYEPARVRASASFPGQAQVPLPPVPHARTPAAMFTAHRVDEVLSRMSHAHERMTVARKAKDPEMRGYHSIHITNHFSHSLEQMHSLVGNLRRNYPAEARELDAVKQTIGLARALSPAAKVATTAHLVETVIHELTHGKRHAIAMRKTEPTAAWEFNAEHCSSHLDSAYKHAVKLAQHLKDNYPAEGQWLDELQRGNDGLLKLAIAVRGYERVEHGRVEHVSPGQRSLAKMAEWHLWSPASGPVWPNYGLVEVGGDVGGVAQSGEGGRGFIGRIERQGLTYHAYHHSGGDAGAHLTRTGALHALAAHHNATYPSRPAAPVSRPLAQAARPPLPPMASAPNYDPERQRLAVEDMGRQYRASPPDDTDFGYYDVDGQENSWRLSMPVTAEHEAAWSDLVGAQERGDQEGYLGAVSRLQELGEQHVGLAAPRGWPGGPPQAGSMLPPSATAPGAKSMYYGRMKHTPSQTTQAPPPLPPGISLPTAKELRALAVQVEVAGDHDGLSSAARHLRAAAEAASHNGSLPDVLSRLRSAQAGLDAAHLEANLDQLPAASVFSSSLSPAEQSSARAEMVEGLKTRNTYRKLRGEVAQHIDRVRRGFFRGQFPPGYPSGWGTSGGATAGLTAELAGEMEKHVIGYLRVEHGKVVHVAPHVQGYDVADKPMGRIVHVKGYIPPPTGEKHGQHTYDTLVGEKADEAIGQGAAIGEFGEHNGNFLDSEGNKHWGWWGGAGLLVRAPGPDGKTVYLMQKRSHGVQNGGTWSTPGGAIDRKDGQVETPEVAAVREGEEEFGKSLPEGTAHVETRTSTWGAGSGAWSYHTVIMQAPAPFDPEGHGVKGVHGTGWESSGYKWVTPEEMADLPLHPAFRATAEELGMPKGGGTKEPEPETFAPPPHDPLKPDDYKAGSRVTWRYKGATITGTVLGPGKTPKGKLPDAYKIKADSGHVGEVPWGALRLVPKPGSGSVLKDAVDSYMTKKPASRFQVGQDVHSISGHWPDGKIVRQASGGEWVVNAGGKEIHVSESFMEPLAPAKVPTVSAPVTQFAKGDRVSYYGNAGSIIATGATAHIIRLDNGQVLNIHVGAPGLRHKVGEIPPG